MALQDLLKTGVKLTDKIILYSPNLNGLVEIERKFGSVEALDKLNKLEDVRFIIYVLVNKKYWDGDIDKPILTEREIGKEIESLELQTISDKLRESFGELVFYSKNSPRSTGEVTR